MAKSSKKGDEDQSEAFKKAARELGLDEDEAAFDNVLKKIAKAPPPKSVQRRKAKPRRER
jgi:hypothetical protein